MSDSIPPPPPTVNEQTDSEPTGTSPKGDPPKVKASPTLLAMAPNNLANLMGSDGEISPRNLRGISRGDSLVFEKKKRGEHVRISINVPSPDRNSVDSPRTPRTPKSPSLSSSLSQSDDCKFRTSTLLNARSASNASSVGDLKIDTTRTFLEQDLPPVNTPSLGNSVSHAGYFNTETLLSKAFNLRTDDLMLSAGAISPRKLPSSPVLQEMDTDADLTTMAKFSSTLVLEHIRHMQTEGEATVQCKEFEGAAMIVDVSGFTKMCEDFSKGGGGDRNDQKSRRKTAVDTGKESEELTANAATFATTLYRLNNEAEAAGRGGERVREVLEAVMGGIIHVVDEYGGDVLRVAGDAVIAVFHSGRKNNVKEPHLVDVCCRCAFECINLLASDEIIEKIGRKMVLHIGISSGTLESYHVCSSSHHQSMFQNVVTGPAFDDVSHALCLASAGEVVVHKRTASLLEKTSWKAGSCREDKEHESRSYKRITPTSKSDEKLHRKSMAGLAKIPPPLERRIEMEPWVQGVATKTMCKVVKRYTPETVRKSASVESAGMLGEIRHATIMFVSLQSDFLTKGNIHIRLNTLEQIFSILHDNVTTYRGIIKEFSVDDKGLVLVSGFGIPPHVGVTPPTRACLCALSIKRELLDMDITSHIGITTGSVYAGSVGSQKRREFCMVGDVVNLAARLMVNAQKTVGKLRECNPDFKADKKSGSGGGGGEAQAPRKTPPKVLVRKESVMQRKSMSPHTFAGRVKEMVKTTSAAISSVQRHILHPKHRDSISRHLGEETDSDVSEEPSSPRPGKSVQELIAGFHTQVKDENHIPMILVDGNTVKEIKMGGKLHFASLPPINVKGKKDLIPINMIFGIDIGAEGEDHLSIEGGALDARRKGLSTYRYRSITDDINRSDEGGSPGGKGIQSDSNVCMSDLYRDTVLSFAQFRMVLPMVLGGTSVDLPLEDLCWIRTHGVPVYARSYSDELEADDRLFVDDHGNLSFGEMDLSFMLEIASTVPSKVQRGISNLVARLETNMQLILKVICIVGGNAPVNLILHLLETVKPFNLYWSTLCSELPRTSIHHEQQDPAKNPPSFSRQSSAPLAGKRNSHEFNFLRRKDAAEQLRVSKLKAYKEKFAKRRSQTMSAGEGGEGQSSISVGKTNSDRERKSEGDKGEGLTEEEEEVGNGEKGIAFTDQMHSRGYELLVETMTRLSSKQFFQFNPTELEKGVNVTDMFMVDTVCGVMPFQQRTSLHEAVAQWHKMETEHDIGERMKRFPIIVHHYVMAMKEERASAELMMLNLLGGDYIDQWVLKQVKPMLPTMTDGKFTASKAAFEEDDYLARSLLALPAIPWLRGLAKAIRGQQIGAVLIKIAARFRTFFDNFRAKKLSGSLKRAVIKVSTVEMLRSGGKEGARAPPLSSISPVGTGLVVTDLKGAKEKTEQVKAERRESRKGAVRQMRRSSSAIVIDDDMRNRLKEFGVGGKGSTGKGEEEECLTPTRVQFAKEGTIMSVGGAGKPFDFDDVGGSGGGGGAIPKTLSIKRSVSEQVTTQVMTPPKSL
ncbi:hypothetical protein TrVE_jg14385 [Triparma verrucosa]|uniref:Guanylate cyclase domain-containing protein n=1 Tax=Triparma verrucosa TaxID=1606542 RepID=A0A9W7FAE1_9STRA|nr:hypothetical protein TrVE_jg14385 [Triparma verrucosa]